MDSRFPRHRRENKGALARRAYDRARIVRNVLIGDGIVIDGMSSVQGVVQDP